MLILEHAWVLWLLPAPLLVRWLAPAHREPREGIIVPFLPRLAEQSGMQPEEGATVMQGGWLRAGCLVAAWICLLTAVARPQIVEPPITKTVPVRDLLLAVDLSGSMSTRDFIGAKGKPVDRLTAVKEVLDDFLARRKGDRVGLILFGTAPFVQAPFTEDLEVCRELLGEAQVSMAGPQTAFGDALGLALNVFERSTTKERVLIALTDGNDTASRVPPAKAASIAHDRGVVIHTISVGDPRAAGEDALDVEALKQVASLSGGLYAHAADRAQLEQVYKRLDALEVHEAETITHRPRRDVYWQPLATGLLLSLVPLAWPLLSVRANRRGAGQVKPPVEEKEAA
jgi:Ca-activated chloride channel family protein